MDSTEDSRGGSILRVRQLLKSMTKGLSNFKTNLAPPKPSDALSRTTLPPELKHMIEIHAKSHESLSGMASQNMEWEGAVENCASTRSDFRSALALAGQARSDSLVEATNSIAALLQRADTSKKNMDTCMVEFAAAMSKLQQKHSAGVQEQLAQLENARHSVDKVLAKQKLVKERGGTEANDLDKVAKREQKLLARRKVFEEQVKALLDALPRTEQKTEQAFCASLLEFLREQREHAAEAARVFQQLDKFVESVEKHHAELKEQLQGAHTSEEDSTENKVMELCGPRIVEVLSAPDFAVAMAISELSLSAELQPSQPPPSSASPSAPLVEPNPTLRALLRLLDDADMGAPFIKLCVSNELPRASSNSSLFRQPSLARALCVEALAMSASAFVRHSFTPLVVQLSSGDADFEVNRRFLLEGDSLEANMDNLCKALQWFIDTTEHALEQAAPPLLRTLAAHVFNLLGPQRRALATHIVAGLLFHCLLSPPIAAPHVHGLVRSEPDDRAQRALKLVVEGLACLADTRPFSRDIPSSRALDEVLDLNRGRVEEMVLRLAHPSLPGGGDEWAAMSDVELAGEGGAEGGAEGGGEREDVRLVRGLMLEHVGELTRVLEERGFAGHLEEVFACLHGRAAAPVHTEASRSEGSELDPEEGGMWTDRKSVV